MFDNYVDSFMNGHFRVEINSRELENGNWEASFTDPQGTRVAVEDESLQEAHRRCADKVREGVLKRELHLGR